MTRGWVLGLVVMAAGATACSSSVTESDGATTSGATTSATATGAGGTGQGGEGQGGGATTTSTGTTTSGQGGAAQGGGGAGQGGAGQGGAPACNGPGPSGDGAVFALSKLFLGDTDRDGTPNHASGWKQYGMNLDGKVSDKSSADLCKPRAGASPAQAYPDGDAGIDNSFGRNILPIFLGLSADLSSKANDTIAAGDASFLLHLVGLSPSGDTCGLSAQWLRGSALGAPPKFDGTDAWPVDPGLLVDPNDLSKGSSVVFASSDLASDAWRTTSTASVSLRIPFGGMDLVLPIDHAHLSMNVDPTRTYATVGTIGGVVRVDALAAEMKKMAGSFDPSLCSGATIDSIVAQLEQAADILADGTQDPTKTCDAISIGVGFDAARVTFAGVGPSLPQPPDPCAP